ncbi:MAG: phosphoglucomutase/phosphomannomutase family protein, partial [Clostridia bacterium]|nr:phosphoglucomutase/phosphomannomutase family protein [Clostridia bacterium]
FEKAREQGLVTYLKAPFNNFVDSILSRLDVETIRNADVRVLFDSMHGSATYPMMAMLYSARCTMDLMNTNKDGYFGGNMPAPGYLQSAKLRTSVVEGGYDLGIEVDGDGDRLAIIDSDGTYIEANQILVMLYYYLHEYRGWRGPVVRNIATTHMLDAVAKSFGEECHEVPVGFKYISAKLDETDAVLGGESSGGLTVRGHIYGKDSIYAAGLFVEMVCAIGKSVGEFWRELVRKYGSYVMVEDNIKFSSDEKERVEKILMEEKIVPEFVGQKLAKISYEDGVKFYFEDDSFVICRFSGTEPLLRIFAESKTKESAAVLIESVKKIIF